MGEPTYLLILTGAAVAGGVTSWFVLRNRPLLLLLTVLVPPILLLGAGVVAAERWVARCNGGDCDLGGLYFLAVGGVPAACWLGGSIIGAIVFVCATLSAGRRNP
jgi:hypothetical protein